MPKRIIDGDALWKSNKLAKLPADMRAEYANLVPLALANGSFECDSRIVWTTVYCYNRPEITVERVQQILDEFEHCGLLVRWTHENKCWGYWVGIDKPGRLPSPTRLKERHERVGPTPPQPMVSQHIPLVSQRSAKVKIDDAKLKEEKQETIGQPIGSLGLGFGLGSKSPPSPPLNGAPSVGENFQRIENQKPKTKTCAMPGCDKPVNSNQAFCSEACYDHAVLLETKYGDGKIKR